MNEKTLFQRFTTIDWGLVAVILSLAACAALIISAFVHFPPTLIWVTRSIIVLVGLPYALYVKWSQLRKEIRKHKNAS